MVHCPALLSAIALTLLSGISHGAPQVWRLAADAALVPGFNEVQELCPSRRVVQTFTAPSEPISGIEVLASRYPKTEPRDLAIRVTDGVRELGYGTVPIPGGIPESVRMAFPAVQANGIVTIEVWAPEGRPGHAAGIQFCPVDCYGSGTFTVGGRPARGDLAFRVLAPDTSEFAVVAGLDLTGRAGRFPSENLVLAGEVTQEFVLPRDSLVAVEFLTGTGGRELGPGLGWELSLSGRVVRQGITGAIGDNVPQRLSFAPLMAVEGHALMLRLWMAEPGAEVRVWLCARSPGTGALAVGGRVVDGSLVMTTLHLGAPEDSMRVILAVDQPPLPEPGMPLAGACAVTQTFRWPVTRSPTDAIGLRLALGDGIVPGKLAYEVRDVRTGEVLFRDSVGVAGKASDDYLWLPLGPPREASRMAVEVMGVETKAENAARLWWIPADVYAGGEATGCVARPRGDCWFRLATSYSPTAWLRRLPSLVAMQDRSISGTILSLLLIARVVVFMGGTALGVLGLKRAERRSYARDSEGRTS